MGACQGDAPALLTGAARGQHLIAKAAQAPNCPRPPGGRGQFVAHNSFHSKPYSKLSFNSWCILTTFGICTLGDSRCACLQPWTPASLMPSRGGLTKNKSTGAVVPHGLQHQRQPNLCGSQATVWNHSLSHTTREQATTALATVVANALPT